MKKYFFTIVLFLSFSFLSLAQDAFLGEVRMFAGNFAPRGWMFCNGQLLSISQNTALFSILGTMYGGDGRTTFALPDMRGRVAVGEGHAPGLTRKKIGTRYGAEYGDVSNVQLSNQDITITDENSASTAGGTNKIGVVTTQNENDNVVSLSQPSLVINYIICVKGLFPSRN